MALTWSGVPVWSQAFVVEFTCKINIIFIRVVISPVWCRCKAARFVWKIKTIRSNLDEHFLPDWAASKAKRFHFRKWSQNAFAWNFPFVDCLLGCENILNFPICLWLKLFTIFLLVYCRIYILDASISNGDLFWDLSLHDIWSREILVHNADWGKAAESFRFILKSSTSKSFS